MKLLVFAPSCACSTFFESSAVDSTNFSFVLVATCAILDQPSENADIKSSPAGACCVGAAEPGGRDSSSLPNAARPSYCFSRGSL